MLNGAVPAPGVPFLAVVSRPHPPSRPVPSSRQVLGPWLAINVGTALASLRGNWFRTGLTMLGIIIGVASVIILVAFGQGARWEITSQIDTLGTNVAVLMPGKVTGQANFNPTGGLGLSNLSQKDVEEVLRVPGIRRAAPITFIAGAVYRGKKPADICMPIATTPEFPLIRRLRVDGGRFFTEAEMNEQVCVLGLGIKKTLFGTEDPIGKPVAVNGAEFRVVGIAAERSIGSGLFGGEELDAMIYLPQRTIMRLMESKIIHRIFMEFDPQANPDAVTDRLQKAVLKSHGDRDDFTVLRAKELMTMFNKVFNLLATLLVGITSISLIVGGIGIMNVMLVTVRERTREIGIRKTVGARKSDIFSQFLTEAVTLSLLGGVIGITLALVVCLIAGHYSPLKPMITLDAVGLGFGVCVVVGILSGTLPAVVAARLDPIVAIRHE